MAADVACGRCITGAGCGTCQIGGISAIRTRLELDKHFRDLALFNLAVDSKLHGCDLISLRLGDVTHGDRIAPRAVILQRKTQQPVQFEITEQTRKDQRY